MNLHAACAYRRQQARISLKRQEGSAAHDAAEASARALKAPQGNGGSEKAGSENT